MGKSLRYYRLKWILLTVQSLMLGFIVGDNVFFSIYRSLSENMNDVLSEAQCDALYHFYRSHEYVGAYFFAILAWMLVVCIDYVIREVIKCKKSREIVRK